MRAFSADVRPLAVVEPAAGVAFGLALLALVVADVAWPVRLAFLATFAVAVAGMRRELRRSAAVRSIAWDGDDRWSLDGTPVTVAPGTRVHPGLVVLVVAAPRRAVHWIPRAALQPDAFRRLKTGLRHGGGARRKPGAESGGKAPC